MAKWNPPQPPDDQWRPLADALQAAMTEAEGSDDYVRATAQIAVLWLNSHGYDVVGRATQEG